MSQLLISKIDSVRRRQVAVSSGTAIAMALGSLLLLVTIGMLADWLSGGADGLPAWVRLCLLVVYAGVIGAILFRSMVHPILHSPDDDSVALLVEEAEPRFAHRLIGAIQLTRPEAVPSGASKSMVRVMVNQAEAIADETDFPGVIPTDRLMRILIAAAAIVLIFMGGFVYGNSNSVSSSLLKRVFLINVPVPRKTHVKIDEGNLKIARGETVVLKARAEGVIPSGGVVNIVTDSGRKLQFPMTPDDNDHSAFSSAMQNVQESFKYSVQLNDAQSPDYTVKVLTRPAVVALEATAILPAYTRQPQVILKTGNFTVLNGSKLRLKVTTNHNVRLTLNEKGIGNTVHLTGLPATRPASGPATAGEESHADVVLKNIPMTVNSAKPTELTCDFDLPLKTTRFSINLIDDDNLQSRDGVVYRIEMVAKKDPVVRITFPMRKEELATEGADILVGYDVYDEFGLSKVSLKYKVDEGDVKTISLPFDPARKQFPGAYKWELSKVSVPPSTTRPSLMGSNIEYWIEVEDTNSVNGPGRGQSEKYTARIVGESEKREELLQRMKEVMSPLEEETHKQEEATRILNEVLSGRSPTSDPAKE